MPAEHSINLGEVAASAARRAGITWSFQGVALPGITRRDLRLRLSLKPEAQIIGEAGDGAGAISLARSLQPDVILMDARMPGMDGIEAAAALRAVARESAVVILSLDDSAKARTRAKEAGAVAFVAKRRMEEELLAVVRRAALGEAGRRINVLRL